MVKGSAIMEMKSSGKSKGMSWMEKLGLIMIFSMAFSAFMVQGWYGAEAGTQTVTITT
jgi:hypothetical protein